MKILIYAIGSRGDVQPFVVLGRALAHRGHDITIAAPKGFATMVAEAGLTLAELPTDFQELLKQPEVAAALTTFRGKLKAFQWSREFMDDLLSAVWRIGQEVALDVIVSHAKAGVAPNLARDLNVPCLPVFLQPGFEPTGEFPNFMIAAQGKNATLNRASYSLMLPTTRMATRMMIRRWQKATGTDIGSAMDPLGGWRPSGGPLRLHAFSPTITPRPVDWPESEIVSGYLFDERIDWAPPDDLAAFLAAGPPPIYAGFGSMPGLDEERTARALIGAIERTGQRAILATGWGGISGIAADERIHVIGAAPHPWLFQRVSAVIHHGGSGTTHEGLRWGRPSVVCPLAADQPFFGARVAALGAGPVPIRQKNLTAENLTAAIETALSPQVVDRAKAVGERVRMENGVAAAIDVIERIYAAR